MPIYEFKCLVCGNYIEFFFKSTEDDVNLSCGECGSEDLERVISNTSYSVSRSNKKNETSLKKTHTCSSGSCTTYNIPGSA